MGQPIAFPRSLTAASAMQQRRREFMRQERPCGCEDSHTLVAALRAVLRDPANVDVNREARLLLQNFDEAPRRGAR